MAVLQDININVHGQPSEKRLQTFLRLSQNENGRMINFRVLGPPLPSNCTATFSGTKPDGNVYSKTGTVAGNFVIIQEDMQMTAVAGVWDAKLDIINGSHNIMTALIRVVIDADVVDPDAIASDSQLQGLVAEAKYYAEHARTDAYGSPLTAPTKAQMTDHTRVYVYTGSEPNMVAGNWYHWDGTAWISGGVYNSVAVQSDTELNDFSTNPVQNKVIKAALDQIEGAIPEIDATLSVAGNAADAKKTGDEISSLKEDLKEKLSLKQWYDKNLWEKGHIAGSTGNNAPSAYNRIRTKSYIPYNILSVVIASGYKGWIYGYNASGVFQGVWSGTTFVKSFSMDYAVTQANLKAISDTYQYRLVVGDDTAQVELTPDDGDKIQFTSFTDVTLTRGGVSADAKAAGDALLPTLQCEYLTSEDATSKYSNLATNLRHNTYSWIGISFFEDMPEDTLSVEYGWIFTLSPTTTRGSDSAVKTQILMLPNPASSIEVFRFYFRRTQSGTMSNWIKYPDTASFVTAKGLLASCDLDDLTGNQCVLLISTNTYTHAPFDIGLVYNLDFSSTLAVQYGYQFGTGAMFYRRKSTTWGGWITLVPNTNKYRTSGKYVAFGDSLTWGAVWSPTSGTAYHRVKEEWRIPTRVALANGMINGFVNEAIGGIGYFKEEGGQTLISQIADYDFTDVELVTVMAGANDHFYTDLGTAADADTANTICGAIKNIIHTISDANPKTQIIIIQPLPCGIDGTQYDVWSSKQGDGYVFRWSLNEFDEQVSALCKSEHVGYVNWADSTYCRNWTNAGYNGTTGPNYTHPTADEDYYLLGNFLAGKVKSLYHGLN